MKKQILLTVAAFVIFILAGSSFFYNRYQKEAKGWRIYTDTLEYKNSKLYEIQRGLEDTIDIIKIEWEADLIAFEDERAKLQIEIKRHEEIQKSLTEKIENYQAERNQLDEKISQLERGISNLENGISSESAQIIAEKNKLIKERDGLLLKLDRLDALISEERQKNIDLTSTIELLKFQANGVFRDIKLINGLLLDILEKINSINKKSYELDKQVTIVHAQGKEVYLLGNIRSKLQMVWEENNQLKLKLKKVEQHIIQFENVSENLAEIPTENNSFNEYIQIMNQEIDNTQKRLLETEKASNIRYLLVAPTDSLIQWELLKKEKGGIFKRRKHEFDEAKLDKSYCMEILTGKTITIPFNKENILKIHTSQPENSFVIEPSKNDPGVSEIVIFDKDEFWLSSLFVVVEIE